MKSNLELRTTVDKPNGKSGYEEITERSGLFPSWRISISFVLFLGTTCLYLMRANMSVAIVCMVIDNATTDNKSSPGYDETCPVHGENNATSNDLGEFDWSRSTTGWILSSFYVGYLITQVPAGWIAKKVGGKILVTIGMIMLTALTLVTPVAARTNVYLLMAVQVLKGGASGLYYPSCFTIWSLWAPPGERSILVNVYMAGAPIGSVLSSIFSGLLCQYGFDGGWPSIFYIFGFVSVFWCLLWMVVGADSPDKHRWISQTESDYIQSTLGTATKSEKETSLKVPWKCLLTTMPFYAILVADFCYHWGWFVALNSLPQYIDDVLQFNITANGLYNALPYLCNFALTIGGSILADGILSKNLLSTTWTRKLLSTIAFVPGGGVAIGIAFLTCHDWQLAVALMSIWVGLMGCCRSGSVVNQVDIAPAYVGLINGIDQTLGTIPGIIAPPITSAMTPNGTPDEWKIVFYTGAVVFLFGWVFYMIFGSGEECEWAKRNQGNKPHTPPSIDEVDSRWDSNKANVNAAYVTEDGYQTFKF